MNAKSSGGVEAKDKCLRCEERTKKEHTLKS